MMIDPLSLNDYPVLVAAKSATIRVEVVDAEPADE
jgi:hypothetical protein